MSVDKQEREKEKASSFGGASGGGRMRDGSRSLCQRSRKGGKDDVTVSMAETSAGVSSRGVGRTAAHAREVEVSALA